MARLQQKTQAAGTTGSAGASRHSPRDGLRLIRDLPGVRALLATVALQIARKAWPQRRGIRTTRFRSSVPMSSPARSSRAAHLHVHRIPRPTLVTIAKRPSWGSRMGGG